MKRAPLMIAAAALITASSLASAADQPGSFPGVVIGAKIIGGDQYEPLYTRIGEWEKLTGAKVNILTKKNGFDIDKEFKSDIAANSVNWCVGWNHTSFAPQYTSLYTDLFKLVPKVGPFSALAFRPPTPEAERLFQDSFKTARDRYRMLLGDARDARIDLPNTDFDTGRLATWGEYPLADETYADLLDALSKRNFADVPRGLRQDITRYFATLDARAPEDKKARQRAAAVRRELAALAAF